MKNTSKEKLIVRLIVENIMYEVAGLENGMDSGDVSKEEYNRFVKEENLNKFADEILNSSYKEDYLESNDSDLVIESKHLKFLGNEKLQMLKKLAVSSALKKI